MEWLSRFFFGRPADEGGGVDEDDTDDGNKTAVLT